MIVSQRDKKIFENLFVLEVANNHNGSMEKGLKIIRNYGQLCRQHSIKAAIKLQFRHIESFVHPDFKGSLADKEKALHYIQKTEKKVHKCRILTPKGVSFLDKLAVQISKNTKKQ